MALLETDRRGFLGASALTVPAFLAGCGVTYLQLKRDPVAAETLETPVLRAMGLGLMAPNPHNTQSWKFEVLGPTAMRLYVDEQRLLPYTDPPARQIHIGEGTFIELLSIGARAEGLAAVVTWFPEGTYGLGEIGTKPVAHVELQPARSAGGRDPLRETVCVRQTNRARYHGAPVGPGEREELASLVGDGAVTIEFITKPAKVARVRALCQRAMTIEARTQRTFEETLSWWRFDADEHHRKGDGLALSTVGVSGIRRWLGEALFVRPSTWHDESNVSAFLDAFDDGLRSTDQFVMLRTGTNTPIDWVESGRAFARLQLAATRLGLVTHPVSQVLQEFPELEETRREFEREFDAAPPGRSRCSLASAGASRSRSRRGGRSATCSHAGSDRGERTVRRVRRGAPGGSVRVAARRRLGGPAAGAAPVVGDRHGRGRLGHEVHVPHRLEIVHDLGLGPAGGRGERAHDLVGLPAATDLALHAEPVALVEPLEDLGRAAAFAAAVLVHRHGRDLAVSEPQYSESPWWPTPTTSWSSNR